MAKVSVRELKSRLSYYLELAQKEVIEVTNWGNVVANVVTPQVDKDRELNLLKDYVKELEAQLKNKPNNVVTSSGTNVVTEPGWEDVEVRKCEWPFCKQTAEREAVYWEWSGQLGEPVSKTLPLCTKHIKESLKRKEQYG